MELTDQVCSLELAKKLKELGVKQESLYFWCDNHLFSRDSMYHSNSETYAAFTIAELGEMLPDCIIDDEDGTNFWIKTWKTGPEWCVAYQYGQTSVYAETALSEADARAKMLIYLIENKLIDYATLQ